jgi:hypothetical protein
MALPLAQSIPSTTISPALDRLLKDIRLTPPGRVIIAIDATASRQPTWDMAAHLTSQMFDGIPAGLQIQLVYYRGQDECSCTKWFNSAKPLSDAMRKIVCRAGITQIRKVIAHASGESKAQKIDAVVLISDACEEPLSDLRAAAEMLKVPMFCFQEGEDPDARFAYGMLADITGGAWAKFDAGAAQRLGELLKAVAAYATGGLKALSHQGSEAARLLLTQIKKN